MKIGIITQPLLNNYGGTLQNYALQRVLISLRCEPVTFDYIPHKSWIRTAMSVMLIPLCYLKGERRSISDCLPPKRDNEISKFLNSHIISTQKLAQYTQQLIGDYQLDGIIVGSDQVWRPKYNQRVIYDNFLRFAYDCDIIKVAYAASFGVDSWEYSKEEQETCRELIRKFNAVSVREQSAKFLCESFLGITPVQVLDPTLLLKEEDYKRIMEHPQSMKEKYLFTYILNTSSEKAQYVDQIKRQCNIESELNITLDTQLRISVQGWLSGLYHSAFVLTDSYHGMVFSILFHKQFLVINNTQRGASRFSSLLSLLGLEDCLVTEESLRNGQIPQPHANWDKVEEILNEHRVKSLSFLKESLACPPNFNYR